MYSIFLNNAIAFVVKAIVSAQQCYVPISAPHCHWPIVWWNGHCHQACQTYRCKLGNLAVGIHSYPCARQIARHMLGLEILQLIREIVSW